MIDFIIDTVFWFVVIWLVVKAISTYLSIKNELILKKIEEHNEKILSRIIHVNIEKHGEVFYLFEKDTNRFIAQGGSFDEIKKHCETRFKDKSVIADESQMDQLGFK